MPFAGGSIASSSDTVPSTAEERDRSSFVQSAQRKGIPLGVDPYPPLHSEPLFAKRLWASRRRSAGFIRRGRRVRRPNHSR